MLFDLFLGPILDYLTTISHYMDISLLLLASARGTWKSDLHLSTVVI